ncbi:hypothetical protein GGF46_001344 [Coemansia sp. RSA 552]|nr:hypothetical protein GGF46_001344 [Coemansia sp. RSA 552]
MSDGNPARSGSGASDAAPRSGLEALAAASAGAQSGGASSSTPSMSLDSDIDQLMKSLSNSVDTTRVSDVDIDKLLGSISASFTADGSAAGMPVSTPDIDPLAALSRDLGIDLKATSSALTPGQAGGLGSPAPQTRPPPQAPRPGHANAGGRFPGRPQVRPGAADPADPSKWLAATMSTLPPEQQERLAELFRGLQSKAVDFPTFMRDAESIMGSKFQDMLAIMRGQGVRPPPGPHNPQQRPPKYGHSQAPPATYRPGPRQGLPGSASTSSPLATPSPGLSSHSSVPGQFMALPGQGSSGDSSMGIFGMGDLSAQQLGGGQGDQGMGGQTPGNTPFETVISRWRQIILNPAIPGEQLSKLSIQLTAFSHRLAHPVGNIANISADERSHQLAQVSNLQSLITHRQRGRAASPASDSNGGDARRKAMGGKMARENSMPQAKKRPADSRRQSSPVPRSSAKKPRTGADDGGPESDMEMLSTQLALAGPTLSLDGISSIGAAAGGHPHGGQSALMAGLAAAQGERRGIPGAYVDADDPMGSSIARNTLSRTSTMDTGGHNSDNDSFGDAGRSRIAQRDAQRRARERRDRDRPGPSGGGGGGDMFSLDDVIGYTGVDLREESEMILSSGMHHDHGRRMPDSGGPDSRRPTLSMHNVGNVRVARNRSLRTDFANAHILEALVAKISKKQHMRAVAADVVPYLSLALQERLRSFMELVSAAAYHRARTQTLPPPPLDPNTRLPLYKITPHLDVKKQLLAIERIDQMREEARLQRITDSERRNVSDHSSPHGDSNAETGPGDEHQKQASAAATDGDESRRQSEGPQPATSSDAGDPNRGTAAPRRGRKKDDAAGETPTYTSKNMPEDLQNKISNLTALRAAGGVRKSWMTAGSSSWSAGSGNNKPEQGQGSADAASPSPHGGTQPGQNAAGAGDLDRSATAPGSGVAHHGHKRNRSSFGTASDHDSSAQASPGPDSASTMAGGPHRSLLPHRSTALSAPLLVTVRDCLFSLERERLGSVRVGRGGGDRVLIQAFSKYGHQ